MSPLERFLHDRSSGAAELAARAVALLEERQARGVSGVRLRRLRRRFVTAHPAMASVWNAAHTTDPVAFRQGLEDGQVATIRQARRLIPRAARVVTLSYSSTVIGALGRRDLWVTVAESLPGGEGRKTAQLLRRLGVRVRVVPDSTVPREVARARLVVVGADAVTPSVVVNKVGTYGLALAAREHRRPCWVVADPSKLVSARWPVPRESPGRAAWFEAVPRRLFTRLVSRRG